MPTKFYLATLGCRVNQADSASLKVKLEARGLEESRTPQECPIIIINSCTVTHHGDREVRALVRRLRRQNPEARLVVTGCYAQRDPGVLARMPGVDLVAGTLEKERLADLVTTARPDPSPLSRGGHSDVLAPLAPARWDAEPRASASGADHQSIYFDASKVFVSDLSRESAIEAQPAGLLEGRTRPHVKIQEGCDSRCAYCIVPFVRGPGRSVPRDSVVAQVRTLIESGHSEIVLTGIHLGSWGTKLRPRCRLADLVESLLNLPGLERLRLSSIEPMRFPRRLIAIAAGDSRLAPHFHLPLQSGSDTVLKEMKRSYSRQQFAELVFDVRRALPHASIGTDVMVGFPGETDTFFEETREFIARLPLSYLHVFPFSRRSGTAAALLPHPVTEPEIHRRARILRDLSGRKLRAFEDGFLASRLRVLLLRDQEGEWRSALSGNYLKVQVPADCGQPNEFVDVTVERRDGKLRGLP